LYNKKCPVRFNNAYSNKPQECNNAYSNKPQECLSVKRKRR